MSGTMPKHPDCQHECQMALDTGMPEHRCAGQCQYHARPESLPSFDTQEEAFEWVERQVDDPCVDNYRFAFEDDPEAVTKYNTAVAEGCCGFFDRTVFVAGKPALIGCNFGH